MTTVTDEMVEAACAEYRERLREYARDFDSDEMTGVRWAEKYGTNLHSTGLGEQWAMGKALAAALSLQSSPVGEIAEPKAWIFELANARNIETDEPCNWGRPQVSLTPPNAGKYQRNVIPLYALSAAPASPANGWQTMETAPKDGTRILIKFVHANAKYSSDPITEGWVAVHEAQWIDHNGGGWTWHGLCGVAEEWMPLPAAFSNPNMEDQANGR